MEQRAFESGEHTYIRTHTFVCKQFMFGFEATHKLIIFFRVFVLNQPVQHIVMERLFSCEMYRTHRIPDRQTIHTYPTWVFVWVWIWRTIETVHIFHFWRLSWAIRSSEFNGVVCYMYWMWSVYVSVYVKICWPIGMTLNLLTDFYQQYAKVSCIRTQDTDNHGMEYADHCSSLAKSISISMNHYLNEIPLIVTRESTHF